ncbi:Lrp/AsnC family transcriptional regulator [Ilumatobacter nonamiensis]|uniref:Lrp/AsnC family transcriptional regulator n=1 Tax=Ilumatobacter nonamiensis TaxID=467093 RepID=UPI000A2F304B|nr:Lrp/AsnC family transcriptional regulator [Ilumatobacter nonamiensis]
MTTLDDVDRQMIDLLRANGRMSAPMLAERLSIGRATAYSRLDRLTDSGAITGFSAHIDPAAVGMAVSALVLVNVRQGLWRDLRDRLRALPGVEWLGVATGRFDFVLLVRGDSLEHLRDVALHDLQHLDGVRSAETIVLLDEIDQRDRPLWDHEH